MATVRVELQGHETPEEAEETLFKALSAQRDGSIHREEFRDPAMRDLLARMQKIHADQFKALLQEIFEILEEEHQDDGHE